LASLGIELYLIEYDDRFMLMQFLAPFQAYQSEEHIQALLIEVLVEDLALVG